MRDRGLGFDVAVAGNGYAWWYVDAMADDGRHGITVIAFIGSVFSPYYKRARSRGIANPAAHCAMNVAIYGPHPRWAMTERATVTRDASRVAIGDSSLAWDGRTLTVVLRERGAPWPSPLEGEIRVHAPRVLDASFALDDEGRHRWHPLAPCARVDVMLTQPALRFAAHGYLDGNRGDAPLEDAFASWHWSRARVANGTAITYDVLRRDGSGRALALHCGDDGAVTPFAPPPLVRLARSGWGIERAARSEGGRAHVMATLLDAPFYARSLVETRLRGLRVASMHESLSLTRFDARWVRALLPFRMRSLA